MLGKIVRYRAPGSFGANEDVCLGTIARIVIEAPHRNDRSATSRIPKGQRSTADLAECVGEPVGFRRFVGFEVPFPAGELESIERNKKI